jgi:superoxide dismutase, Fe-Mn family
MSLTRRGLLRSTIPAAAFAVAGGGLFGSIASAKPAASDGYFAPSNFFADGEWKLPKLPYAYDALEPHIDAKTMEIHHAKHHQAYVTNLNKALKQMKELPDDVTPQTVEALQRDVSFNMGGHALHSIFWGIIGPGAESSKMGGEPAGGLIEAINAQFGSFAKFKKYFSTVATTVKGSGWAILGFSPVSRSLVTYAVKDQDSTHPAGVMPILGVDVWEHAYYLKYQNDRAAYVKAWWETINWTSVGTLMG